MERAFDDLSGRLADARAGEQIGKAEFFTVLSYQPASDKMLLLHDVAKVLNLNFNAARTEFTEFEKNLEADRTKNLYQPLKSKSVYQRPAKDPNADTPETDTWKTVEPLQTENVKDFLARDIPPPRWIVEPILKEGLAIFAGPSKLGKSLICLNLVIAISSGRHFLDEYFCEPGPAIYICLEDGENLLWERLKTIIDGENIEGLELLDKTFTIRKSIDGGLAQVENWLNKHLNARLVIVDTLAHIRQAPGRNANPYLADTEFMMPFQLLALKYRVCIMLVHHTRKMIANDPLDRISGTTGLVGVADVAWILKRESRGRAEAILEIFGRGVKPAEIGISMNEKFQWTYQGRAEDIQKTGERQAIVDLLSKKPGDIFASADIAKTLQKKQTTVCYLLKKLMQDGIVLSGGYSKYYIPKERI